MKIMTVNEIIEKYKISRTHFWEIRKLDESFKPIVNSPLRFNESDVKKLLKKYRSKDEKN